MNRIKAGKVSYFEMEEFEQATDTGIDDVVSEKVALTATAKRSDAKQSTLTEAKNREASAEAVHSCRPDAPVEMQRRLYIITTVAVVSFLMSAAALILALTIMMMSRNHPSASTGRATVQEIKLLDKSTGRNVSVQTLLRRIQDLENKTLAMEEKIIMSVMDGLWRNMTATHETFEKKLDAGFKLLIASIKALNNSDGELTSTMNALRQDQILTKRVSERLAVNVTQLESDAQELKKASGNVSSRAGSLERGYTQMNSLIKTLQAVNAAQNASHQDLQSLYKRLNDSLTTVNATLNDKDPNKPSAHIEAAYLRKVTYQVNTVIKDWSVSAPHSHLAGDMKYNDGNLTVPIPGRYYIYAQFYYHSNGRVNVLVNNRRITMLHFPTGAGSLYTGGVFNLKAGDVITLTTHFSFRGWMASFHSYFGAFLI